jgi:hypothetical protein
MPQSTRHLFVHAMRVCVVQAAATEVTRGSLLQMCVSHGDSPLIRAVRKNDIQLVSAIASRLHPKALDEEVRDMLCFPTMSTMTVQLHVHSCSVCVVVLLFTLWCSLLFTHC